MKTIISIIISILIFILIIVMIVLILNQMGERFSRDCEKQNYTGIKSYVDFDVDCSQFYGLKDRTTTGFNREQSK